MRFRRDEDGNAVLTMTFEELGIIRYTLDVGAAKLQMHAKFFKTMEYKGQSDSTETADKAKKVVEELERVVTEWASRKEE